MKEIKGTLHDVRVCPDNVKWVPCEWVPPINKFDCVTIHSTPRHTEEGEI